MYDFVYPIAAIRDDGTTIIATSPKEAVAFNRLRPGPRHVQGIMYICGRSQHGCVWRESVVRHEWIVRDHHGNVVLHEDLPHSDAPRRRWHAQHLRTVRHAAERGLPIPGTGRRPRYSSGYRGFRINIAMRAAEESLAADMADWDVGHLNVGRVRSRTLPHAWDEVEWRSDRRGWKDRRSHQWR